MHTYTHKHATEPVAVSKQPCYAQRCCHLSYSEFLFLSSHSVAVVHVRTKRVCTHTHTHTHTYIIVIVWDCVVIAAAIKHRTPPGNRLEQRRGQITFIWMAIRVTLPLESQGGLCVCVCVCVCVRARARVSENV